MIKDIKEQAEMKELMSIDDVANYTGLKVGYLYQLTSKRILPHYKPTGKLLFFKRSEIDDFFFSKKRKSMVELEQEATNFSLTNKKK